MMELLIALGQFFGGLVGLCVLGVIAWCLLSDDDAPPVDESRMDCFCPNVGIPQDVEQHEVTCRECGRYAELGTGD